MLSLVVCRELHRGGKSARAGVFAQYESLLHKSTAAASAVRDMSSTTDREGRWPPSAQHDRESPRIGMVAGTLEVT